MLHPGQHMGKLARERLYVGHKHIGESCLHCCLSSIEQVLHPLLETVIPPFWPVIARIHPLSHPSVPLLTNRFPELLRTATSTSGHLPTVCLDSSLDKRKKLLVICGQRLHTFQVQSVSHLFIQCPQLVKIRIRGVQFHRHVLAALHAT